MASVIAAMDQMLCSTHLTTSVQTRRASCLGFGIRTRVSCYVAVLSVRFVELLQDACTWVGPYQLWLYKMELLLTFTSAVIPFTILCCSKHNLSCAMKPPTPLNTQHLTSFLKCKSRPTVQGQGVSDAYMIPGVDPSHTLNMVHHAALPTLSVDLHARCV